MNDRIKTLMDARTTALESAKLLRKTAAAMAEDGAVGHRAAADAPPAIDMDDARATFEKMVADGLSRQADIDTALIAVERDPNALLLVVENLAGQVVEHRAKAESYAPVAKDDSPGVLVGKVAASGRIGAGESMGARLAQAARNAEAKAAARRR